MASSFAPPRSKSHDFPALRIASVSMSRLRAFGALVQAHDPPSAGRYPPAVRLRAMRESLRTGQPHADRDRIAAFLRRRSDRAVVSFPGRRPESRYRVPAGRAAERRLLPAVRAPLHHLALRIA